MVVKGCLSILNIDTINEQKYFKMKNLSEQRGNWNEQKEKLKQRFSILTDDDLNIVRGNKDEILRRLQN